MTARNDITGDAIRSRTLSEQGRENWDRIFKKPEQKSCSYPDCKCPFDMRSGENCMKGLGVVP